MHYSPSEKDGVFIVEAARGADQNGSYTSPSSIKPQRSIENPPELTNGEIKIDSLQNNYAPSSPEEESKKNPEPQKVEVHTPPTELSEKESVICNGAKTGLSQSDLSLTSSNSSNQGYSYGHPETYQYEEKGYKGSSPKRIINIHCHNDLKPLIENSPPNDDPNKPKITAAIYKQESINGDETLNSDKMEKTEAPAKSPIKNHKILNGDVLHLKEDLDEIIPVPEKFDNLISNSLGKVECNGEVNLDSLSLLPPPPLAVDEINDQTLLGLDTMDSLPPPPPLAAPTES